jgi:glycosyltransferase involved in cell wall biosynthesis
VVPHKKTEDVIALFSRFHTLFPDSDVQLQVIGVFPESEYKQAILSFVSQLAISDKINFRGFVTDEELIDAYANANCYVLMSEHEGFGVPLLEALKAEVPILAYQKNSVGEVLGEAGCQITEKDYDLSAIVLHQILIDDPYRQTIISGQCEQLKKLMVLCDDSVFLKLI